MGSCLFCKMISGEIKPDTLFENERVLGFRDINPQAPLHALVLPKKHIATINDIEADDAPLIGELYLAAKQIAAAEGEATEGYRTVMNCNARAGQSVFHLHLHLLAGRDLTWPPG